MDISPVAPVIIFCKVLPVVIRFPLSISRRESKLFPEAIRFPLKVDNWNSKLFPVVIKWPLKTPISSVKGSSCNY